MEKKYSNLTNKIQALKLKEMEMENRMSAMQKRSNQIEEIKKQKNDFKNEVKENKELKQRLLKEQKREKEAKKKQKVIDVKEVKFRPGIEDHDFEVKLKNAMRFLNDGDKVKCTIMFRGRELTHPELGEALLDRVAEKLKDVASC